MNSTDIALARRILVIDDNQAIHRDFETILMENAGSRATSELEDFLFGDVGGKKTAANRYELDFALQGREGVQMVKDALKEERPYMLAFVDMRMPPGWDGLETIERLWEADPAIQVVICSAYNDYSWEEMTTRLGPRDNLLILEKPFEINEVSQMAAALTEKWLMTRKAVASARNLGQIVAERTHQIKSEKEKVQRYLDIVGAMVVAFDKDHRVTMINRQGCRELGYTEDDILGKDWCDTFVPQVSRQDVRTMLTQLAQGDLGRYEFYENPVQTNGNGQRIIAWHNTIVCDDKGCVEGILSSGEDITQRKEAEVIAQAAYARTEQANSDLKNMQSQLVQQEKLASIGQLAAGVAHEMNNPVGFVASNFETLEGYVARLESLMLMYENLLKEVKNVGSQSLRNKAEMVEKTRSNMKMDFVMSDIEQLVKDSRDGLARVTGIIQNLRDFSRIDQPDAMAEFSLNDCINATLIVVRNETKYHCDIKLDLGDIPRITGNAGQVNQVLLNILVNASQAIRSQERQENGSIAIKTCSDDKHVVCQIVDDGPGIAAEHLSKVFDPFFTTKPVGKGTGLGLSVSHDIIVNKHKGELLVESTPGKGASFTIRLPINRKDQTTLKG